MNVPATLTLRSAPVGPVQLALFAAASGDHNPLHLDPEVARKAGFERPVVHGMLTMALAGRLLRMLPRPIYDRAFANAPRKPRAP